MAKNTITQETFDALLNWLDSNHETAGQKYETIRQRLIRIFAGRGCNEAEELADETIIRVTLKLPRIIGNYSGEPKLYFYGVADKIHLEWLRKQRKITSLEFTEAVDGNEPPESESEIEYECLELCLESLPEKQRGLIVDYYQEEKIAKIEHRKRIAESLGISVNALQVKTSRIRNILKECVQNCVAERTK